MNRFERHAVWWSSVAATVTGVGLAIFKYLFEPSDPFALVNHPLQPWMLRAHLLSVPALVFAVGAIAIRHVWKHYRRGVRRARRTGLLTALALAPMIFSGYLIQVVTHAGWLEAIIVAHLATSALYALGVAAHQWILTRRRRD